MGNSSSDISDLPDVSTFNSLVTTVKNKLTCNAACQKEKQEKKLKQKLDKSEVNLLSAPNKFKDAQKNYITFSQGELAYNELLDKQLIEKANIITTEFQDSFNEISNKINTQVDTYNGILINFNNIVDLYLKYKKENTQLIKELKNTNGDIVTNDRKTFYQEEQIQHLNFYYYKIILIIYIVCVVCFAIFSFIYPSKTNWKTQLLTFIALVLLPFVSTWILGTIIYLKHKIFSFLPKDVYL
jgi:hypothetical protein